MKKALEDKTFEQFMLEKAEKQRARVGFTVHNFINNNVLFLGACHFETQQILKVD